jgi:hypothetical protein
VYSQLRLYSALILSSFLIACSTSTSAQPTPSSQASMPTSETQIILPESTSVPIPPTATISPTNTSVPPTPTNTPLPARLLQLEDPRLEGDDVRELQQRLADLGYIEVGIVDGIFGPLTQEAVKAFQQNNNLTIDGIVGPQTNEVLYSDRAIGSQAVMILIDAQTGFVLGGSDQSGWIKAQDAALRTPAELQYHLYSLGGFVSSSIGKQAQPGDIPCVEAFTVDLQPEFVPDTVGIASVWQAQPRVPRLAPTTDRERQVLADWLSLQGMPSTPLNILQVLEIDLEGDGVNEYIIEATHFPEDTETLFTPRAGDYSVILLWDGQSEDASLITGEWHAQDKPSFVRNTSRMIALLDLNGDQVLEVIVESSYYEGRFVEAYTQTDHGFEYVFGSGCGV